MKYLRWAAALILILTVVALRLGVPSATPVLASGAPGHESLDCATSALCTEVQDPESVFGEDRYVGHDRPSVLFYSNQPGSGNNLTWQVTLPTDPTPGPGGVPSAGQSFNFQLQSAFWLSMAVCDTQSYPEQVSTCTPDSDSNILDPAVSPNHAGTAVAELQFYPPGWVSLPAGNSCDPTRWCAALNIFSLSENPVTGTTLNATCAAVTGLESDNFAFVTTSGVPQPGSPPNPVQSTVSTFTPNPASDLLMSSGDRLTVSLHDSPNGLVAAIDDQTAGQNGSMTASAANGFGQVLFAPTGTSCTNIPYNFHPMYSTSSEQTRVIWAAQSSNIRFAGGIGHFDYCNGPNTVAATGSCPAGNLEGVSGDQKPIDADDTSCFPPPGSGFIQVSGCIGQNTGFDGTSYQPDWPDGSALHPTSVRFSSPTTAGGLNYNRIAFETDLPRIESTCNRATGAGCTLIPTRDDETPARFYPFFSTGTAGGQCSWLFGNDIPGLSTNDFGKNSQYGPLLAQDFLIFGGGGATSTMFDDFRQVLSSNPCGVVPTLLTLTTPGPRTHVFTLTVTPSPSSPCTGTFTGTGANETLTGAYYGTTAYFEVTAPGSPAFYYGTLTGAGTGRAIGTGKTSGGVPQTYIASTTGLFQPDQRGCLDLGLAGAGQLTGTTAKTTTTRTIGTVSDADGFSSVNPDLTVTVSLGDGSQVHCAGSACVTGAIRPESVRLVNCQRAAVPTLPFGLVFPGIPLDTSCDVQVTHVYQTANAYQLTLGTSDGDQTSQPAPVVDSIQVS